MSTMNHVSPVRAAALLAALLLCLTGCGSGGTNGDSTMGEATYAQSLYDSRISYVGDNAAVASLLSQMGVNNRMGDYTLELQTDSEPYSVTLHFQQTPENEQAFADQFEYYAVLTLALIDNCDEVRCTYPTDSGDHSLSWNMQQADEHLKLNVDACGESADGVANLLDTIRETHQGNQNMMDFFEENGVSSLESAS